MHIRTGTPSIVNHRCIGRLTYRPSIDGDPSSFKQDRVGCRIYLGRTHTTPCPVSAVLTYISIRTAPPGPLFLFQDGTPLTRAALVTHLRAALSQAGVDSSPYSGHSFRIGAATTAARAGYQDSFIQTLGRWKPAAFITYIRTSPSELAAVSTSLARKRPNL